MAIRGFLVHFRLSWIYFLHAVFSGLLLAKLIEETSWNWFLVFVPVFVFDLLCAIYWITYLVTYVRLKYNGRLDDDLFDTFCIPNDEPDYNPVCFPRQAVSALVLLMYFIGILLKLASEVLLCLALNGTISFIAPGSTYSVLFFATGLSLFYFSLKPTFMLANETGCCCR